MSGNGNPNRRPPPMTGNGSYYRHQQMSNGNHHSSNYHKHHSYVGGYNNYSSHPQNRNMHGQGGRGGHNSYNNYNQSQGYGNHYGHPGMYNSNINSNSNSSINANHNSNTNPSSRCLESKKQKPSNDNNSTSLLSSRRQHTKNAKLNSVNSQSSSLERSTKSPQSNGSYLSNSANNDHSRNFIPASIIDIKNESDLKYNNNIKKALDINSLQPMKKPSKVKEEKKERAEDEENEKKEQEEEKKKEEKVPDNKNIEKCVTVEDKQDINKLSDVTNIKIEKRTTEEEKVDENKFEESPEILMQPAKSANKNVESIVDDDEDEKPILNGKKKFGSAEPSSQAGTQNESEGDTDIEESIPLPSKKARRLHRLMRKTNSDDESNDDESNNKFTNFKQQKRRISSASQSSRSQSPKARKVSSRTGKDASGRSLLQRVCAKGHYEEAKELIESGANVNDADYAGITPLHEAALEGFTDLVKLLLDNGADIDVQSGHMDKDTPLIDATSNLHYDVVKLLLQRNANPTLYNAQGDTALDALDANRDTTEIDEEDLSTIKKLKKLLAQATREFRKKSKHYNQQYNDGTSDSEDMDSLSRRQNNNTFYDLVTREGRSGIYSKVAENDVTFVLNYVSNLSGSNIPPDLLTIASKHGHTDIASLLIAFGGNANYVDKKGLTPLMYAVGKDHTDMVKLLLQNQADVTIKDKQGRTALDILMESDIPDEDEMKLLKDKLSNPTVQDGNEMKVDKEDSNSNDKKNKSSRNKLKRKRVIESNEEEEEDEENEEEEEEEEEEGVDDSDEKDKGDTVQSTSVLMETKLKKRKKLKLSDDMNTSSSTSSLSTEKMPTTHEQTDLFGADSLNENSVSTKLGKNEENKHSSSGDKIEKTENDGIAEDDKKSIEMPAKETAVLTQEEIEAREEKERKEIEIKRLKEIEENEAKREKELEELEAKKEKELEAKKAREALEQERLERKRLKQEKIAKSIEEFEKKREAEKKAAELEELEKKRKKEDELAKRLEEDRERKRIEMEKQDLERRKLIRSFYPYGLQIAKFKKSQCKEDILKYLPLYCFTINCECFVIDIQLNLILGVEDLYSCYPTLKKTQVKYDEKPHIWNLLWPMIGSFVKSEGSIDEMKKRYDIEENNFKELIVNWVRFSEFEDILNKNEELELLRDGIEEIGMCNVEIPGTVSTDLKSKELPPTEFSANNVMCAPISQADSEYKEFPLNFGKKAKHAMKFINKKLW